MKVLITGGTGFIGRELILDLLKDGHEPWVLSRNPRLHPDFPAGVKLIQWDAQTTQGWGHLIEQVDGIVNLAGENLAGKNFFPSRWTPERKKRILDSRLDVGRALSEAIGSAERKPAVLVQGSAIGYYGVLEDQIVTEVEPSGDDYMAKTVAEWEASTADVEAHGVRRAIIRTGIVLDPKEGALMRLLLPYRLFAGGPFGSGEQWYSWIHLRDVVRAITFLLENEQANGVFNLTAPKPLKNKEFGRILGKVMRRPSLVPLPGFVLRTLFGEVSTVVLDGQRVLPERLNEMGFEFEFPEAEGAFQDLLL